MQDRVNSCVQCCQSWPPLVLTVDGLLIVALKGNGRDVAVVRGAAAGPHAASLGPAAHSAPALQVFFPLAPGVETIYEPAMEEVAEMLGAAKGKLENMESGVSTAAKRMDRKLLAWLPWRR